MRGLSDTLSVGERIAWYRQRRGMSQEVLAGLVGRTADWLSKIENNRIDLDRLSVLHSLASALDVTIGDLIGEPSLLDWSADSGRSTVPALRTALMDYRQITPPPAGHADRYATGTGCTRPRYGPGLGRLSGFALRLCDQ
jgi:transcriptional regulator with XRE-family HTH domain